MRTQHNFCTQQFRYVRITKIVILFCLNLCAGSRENSFQEVLEAVLFGGLEYTSNSSRLAPLWEPNYGEHDVHFICGVDIVRIGTYIEQCVSLVILFLWGSGKFWFPQGRPHERVRSPRFESRHGKLLRDGCACAARVNLGMRNVRRVLVTDI